MNNCELFDSLVQAEDEETVDQILKVAGYFNDEAAWLPLGFENNFAAIGNQHSDPVGAMAEKIVNGIDAILTAECYARGIDPEGPQAPQTMAEAVELFFGVREGRIASLSANQQQQLADNIHLVAVGTKSNPSYLLIDRGEGQTPERFPDTLLSLLKSNKIRIPFVQGRFNSGGTGILQFCGERNYQLIASRRRPGCPVEPGDSTAALWGFTIVRRMLPSGGRKSSMYVYLAPGGVVPTFQADTIKVLPGRSAKDRPAPAYAVGLEYGTCVKLYNYRWTGLKSNITLDARYGLEQLLQAPCLPFRLTETRDYRANYYSTTVIGGWNSVAGGEDGNSAKLENGFPAFASLSLERIGDLSYQIAAYKEEINRRHVATGIHFTLNGQVHGSLPADYVTRRLKFDYLKNNLLVLVDCTVMDQRVREDFFMASRDRVRRNDVYSEIEKRLTENLRDHPGLQELNQRRRQQALERTISEEGPDEALQALINSDPSLAALFAGGDRLVTSTGPGVQPPYVGRQFPTFFRLPREGIIKECPGNRTCRVDFETDAANDYFTRYDSPGSIHIDPPNLIESQHLWNGKWATRFRAPWDAKPGDQITVTVTVTDIEREARGKPFVSTFTIKVMADTTEEPRPGIPRTPRAPISHGNTRGVALAVPIVREVRRDQWAGPQFDPPLTEFDALRVTHNDNGGYDYWLNLDNTFFLQEVSRAREGERAQYKHWFRHGLLLAAIGMLRHDRRRVEALYAASAANGHQADGHDEGDLGDDLDAISRYCNGLGQVIIPIIRSLTREQTV